jgi:nitrate/nitrite transporter NarK
VRRERGVREFLQVGHWPTLFSAFLDFDLSSMVWVLVGALGVCIAQDCRLSASQKGVLVTLGALLLLLIVQRAWQESWAGKANPTVVGD